MLDTILLLVADERLRRLYHELLIQQELEVIPVSTIEDAMLTETSRKCRLLVIYPDDLSLPKLKVLFYIQAHLTSIQDTVLTLLTSDTELYLSHLRDQDHIIDIGRISPIMVVEQIKALTKITW